MAFYFIFYREMLNFIYKSNDTNDMRNNGMVKKLSLFIMAVCVMGALGAAQLFAQEDMCIGFGPVVNSHTRNGVAAGGVFYGSKDIDEKYTVGLKLGLFYDFESVTTVEPVAFLRYYLPFETQGFFAQLDAGLVVYFEDGGTYPAFSGGVAFGRRFAIDEKWYFEPTIRAGYPYGWGLGLLFVRRLDP